MLGLVEPQATGIGGGGFVEYFDAATKTVATYDAREAAPATADGSYFLDASGNPLGFSTAVVSGRSVGVPTVVKLWDKERGAHGTMPLATLLLPAIKLAQQGFAISAAHGRVDRLVPGGPRAGRQCARLFPPARRQRADIIGIGPDGILGGNDPRREGIAAGE